MNKNGNLLGIMFAIIIFFLVGFMFIFSWQVFQPLNDVYDTGVFNATFDGRDISRGIQVGSQDVIKNMDGLYGLLVVLLSGAIVVSAIFVDTHPSFFVVSLIFLAIVLWLSGNISNVFYDVTQNPDISTATFAAQFPIVIFIMNHLPIWIAVLGGITLFVFYGKYKA